MCHDCITREILKIAQLFFDPAAKGRDGISGSRKLLVLLIGAQPGDREESEVALDIRALGCSLLWL